MTASSDRAVRRLRDLMTRPGTDWYGDPQTLRAVAYVVDAAHGVVTARDHLDNVLAATALTEAETERGNDDAVAGLVVLKRHGNANPADQLVVMTLRDLAALITGTRPEDPTAQGDL